MKAKPNVARTERNLKIFEWLVKKLQLKYKVKNYKKSLSVDLTFFLVGAVLYKAVSGNR